MSSTVQTNTHIDAELKAAGDQALTHLGYTPAQAARELWQFTAARQNEPEHITGVLSKEAGERTDAMQQRLDALARGRELCAGFSSTPTHTDTLTYKELRGLNYSARLAEME